MDFGAMILSVLFCSRISEIKVFLLIYLLILVLVSLKFEFYMGFHCGNGGGL